MNLSQTSYTESFYLTLVQPRVYPRGSWSLSYLLIMENNQKDSNFQSYLLNLNIKLLNCVVPSQSKHISGEKPSAKFIYTEVLDQSN